MKSQSWQFWIDRGGTFTDCLGISPEQHIFTAKVLSSDSAPVEAIEKVLNESGETTPARELICRVKLGTTVSTNALLERRGVPTALLTNRGLAGVFDIGTQERPALFELEIEMPARLQRWRLETPGRRDANGEVIESLDLEAARVTLASALAEGARAVAIIWMHAHAFPEDELELAEVAREVGFDYVACSHAQAREIGFLSRGETAIADAYLTPLLQGHVEALRTALPRAELRFMQSSGGLTDAERFRGPIALLSGPAGGVVAARQVARDAGYERAIGFDMGGTSTDVSLIAGRALDRAFESEVGGVRVKAPMLRIHTVAAGGGSLCRFDGIRLTVGPESAGSNPGPLCYVANDSSEIEGDVGAGELTVTDINLALGRVAADRFPFALRRAPVDAALDRLIVELAATGFDRTREEVAAGFFEIANASMAQAIIEVSVERGADPRDHVLVGFGGAGGQHVCAIAQRLGIQKILLHPHAGLLSALGIGLARASWDGQRDGRGRRLPESGGLSSSIEEDWTALAREGLATLAEEGVSAGRLRIERSLDLVYAGSDTALPILLPDGDGDGARDTDTLRDSDAASDASVWRRAFETAHRERFGYLRSGRAIELKALRVRVHEPEAAPSSTASSSEPLAQGSEPVILRQEAVWFPTLGRVRARVYQREALEPGHRLVGPALILEATGTVVLDPGFELEVNGAGVFRLTATQDESARVAVDLSEADPVRLEVLGNRFMSIAEQMGAVLRNTAVSTNIKERLDYSCAVFDGEGGLVANAPHIPVHLGAMADTVSQIRARFSPFRPGDVLVTNDPFAGGSHLPDVTVVTPVFRSGEGTPDFFVASRGHHADIGGKTPGSMPANSTSLAEEGVLIEAFHLVRAGVFDEERIRAILGSGRYPARRPDDNVADLEAMVAANQAGAALLTRLVEEVGLEVVHVTMQQLQSAAAAKVARELARLSPGDHSFADRLDDGTPICVRLSIEHRAGGVGGADGGPRREAGVGLPARMKIDFAGTGPASNGNLNAPSSVVRAAVIYVLRSLVAERIPLNGGCLIPVEVSIPPGSILDPPAGSAVVGGNVETSQRVVDVLLGALGRAAASQGTMNNVTFGDEDFGYYETIGGGAGATPFADGASGVHTHMTNTRITDPEILEVRYPVRLLEFGLRPGTGGAGARRGGDGVVRRILFLRPVVVSLLTERRVFAPFGLEGGQSGAKGQNSVLRRGHPNRDPLEGRVEVALKAGDELSIETPGGGGFGSRAGATQEH